MIRTAFAAAASLAALALAPQPVAARNAQDDVAAQPAGEGDPMQAAMDQLGAMFPVEPLTPEQQARLPQATRIITRMIPEGTLGEMMGGMFDRLLGPMLSATDAPAYPVVEKGLGISLAVINLTEEQAAEIAVLLDPAYAERHTREVAVMPVVMRDMMTLMEPPMRKAMSELYAVHFSQKELDDIETFFQTESGAAYARKSFAMSSDPRIVAASMEAMPQIMGAFAEMEKKMAAASADLPPKRSFAELSASEKARIAKLTGYTVKEIEQMAAENRSEAEGAID
ncbi:DUF2059 domain-containing protein [Erythrobacter sp. CCH5-A1]|jgi:hypothetical protein|uniref:DUF2059 domain-containing protein n=1 Tax=Erythrobacter sp. CCH5-A1 TaxID=1768792 RepID=UPI00082E3F6D|nr:DUF2059 domain-containing protein [Erythrobacter sp. CCH5-A1]